LAYLITGSESDWSKLGRPQDDVKNGATINIAPLLSALEDNLRLKVVAATSAFKAAGFGPLSVTITGRTPSDDLNQFFGKEGRLSCDCLNAANSVLQKGLLDMIGSNLYDKLDQSYTAMFSSRKGLISSMQNGDLGWFPNYADYLSKVQRFKSQGFQAENVVKIGQDQFWGFTGVNEVHNQKDWEDELREAYNAPDGQRAGKQRHGRIPGFLRPITIDFLNVANISSQLFDIRNK
jgi:hypothetical protein